jgi:hypothetical protein
MSLPLETPRDHFERITLLNERGRRGAALAAAREAARLFPRHRRAWWLLGQCELEAGDDVAAWRAFKTGHRLDSEGIAVTGLLSILLARGRLRSAEVLAAKLAPRVGQLARLDGLLAKIALARRDADRAEDILQRAAQAGHSSSLLKRAASSLAVMRRELAHDTMRGIRHIAIGGVSHVGSTVLGIILGSMPGFAFAGETHSLREVKLKHVGKRGKVPVSRDIPSKQWPVACRVCKRGCAVFDEEYRLSLVDEPACLYGSVARHLGTDNLVTSDKSPLIYTLYDPLYRFDLIVCYKSPSQQARSVLKDLIHTNKPIDEQMFVKSLNEWARNYLEQLFLLNCSGKKVFLQWERFVADPASHMDRLASVFGIPLAADILTNIRIGHFVGGNTGVDVPEVRKSGAISLRPSTAPPLPPEIEDIVRAHKRAAYVHGLLERRYHEVFSR